MVGCITISFSGQFSQGFGKIMIAEVSWWLKTEDWHTYYLYFVHFVDMEHRPDVSISMIIYMMIMDLVRFAKSKHGRSLTKLFHFNSQYWNKFRPQLKHKLIKVKFIKTTQFLLETWSCSANCLCYVLHVIAASVCLLWSFNFTKIYLTLGLAGTGPLNVLKLLLQ